MFNIIELLIEGSQKLSGSRIGYGVLVPLLILTLLLLSWSNIDFGTNAPSLPQEIWRPISWALALLLATMIVLAFLTRPKITKEEKLLQLTKAHTMGLAAVPLALIFLGTRAMRSDYPNSILIAVAVQSVVFLFAIIFRTLDQNRHQPDNGEESPSLMYVQLAIITGALLLGSATNMRSMEHELSETPFRSESEYQAALSIMRKFPNSRIAPDYDANAYITTDEILDELERDVPNSSRDRPAIESYTHSPDVPLSSDPIITATHQAKEESLRSFRTFLKDTITFRAKRDELERYRFVRFVLFGSWCICIIFWAGRIIRRFRIQADIKGI